MASIEGSFGAIAGERAWGCLLLRASAGGRWQVAPCFGLTPPPYLARPRRQGLALGAQSLDISPPLPTRKGAGVLRGEGEVEGVRSQWGGLAGRTLPWGRGFPALPPSLSRSPRAPAAPTETRPLPALVSLPVAVRTSICRDFPWPGLWLPWLAGYWGTWPLLPCLLSDFVDETDSLAASRPVRLRAAGQ